MTGPLRISAPIRAATVGRQTGRADPWLGRLVKLVPAEIVAVFLAGRPLAQERYAGGWPVACLVLLVIVRAWTTRCTLRSRVLTGIGSRSARAYSAFTGRGSISSCGFSTSAGCRRLRMQWSGCGFQY